MGGGAAGRPVDALATSEQCADGRDRALIVASETARGVLDLQPRDPWTIGRVDNAAEHDFLEHADRAARVDARPVRGILHAPVMHEKEME